MRRPRSFARRALLLLGLVVPSSVGAQAVSAARSQQVENAVIQQGEDAFALQEENAAAAADDFVAATRAGIAQFRDRSAAIAAGYRRLGPSFPGMGEHWIHPGHIVQDRITQGRPAVLCYAVVDGSARLLGAAYAFPLLAGAPLPPLPGGAAAWHVHDGAVDEETLLLVHPAASARAGTRLVMAHVWTELENTDGVFAQNNWALPFVQAGMTLAAPPDMHAAQVVSLLSAGPAYYQELFDAIAQPSATERAAMAAVLLRARERVAAWRAERAAIDVDAAEMRMLAGEWARLWKELQASVGAATAERLRAYSGAAEHMHH